jgi:hypothetical protein
MLFMEFLASRQFESLPYIDFREPDLGFDSFFGEKQWRDLHKV